ncbi:MAG: hypothetical protein CMH56_09485 [Myxococcales bacterium]|nr:hypothetical protein [Myxococcales bacterium]
MGGTELSLGSFQMAISNTVNNTTSVTNNNTVNNININININNINSPTGVTAVNNFQSLTQRPGFSSYVSATSVHCGTVGQLPKPQVAQAGTPAGKGLSKDPQGWPKGTIKTAGGYHIVPEGKQAAWKIYGPDQKHGQKANTRVWGDPHVSEKDGTRWDFTKNSDFLLPDGTRINCQTTSETGKSVSKGLTISNGMDKVNVSGINTNHPKTGEITKDGYEWRAKHIQGNPTRDTFRLGGDSKNIHWFKDGKSGSDLITGAYYKNNAYQQKINPNKKYWVAPQMRPATGSNAWGNQIRNQTTDVLGHLSQSQSQAQLNGSFMALDHAKQELNQAIGPFKPYQPSINTWGHFGMGFGSESNSYFESHAWTDGVNSGYAAFGVSSNYHAFGGLGCYFNDWGHAFGCVGAMGDLFNAHDYFAVSTTSFMASRLC